MKDEALKGAIGAEYQKSPWDGKGISMPPPAASDLQAELDATNRQVEILSDALAESRREVDAMVALARADEREACAKVCDDIDVEYEGEDVLATWCSRAIRARGETK
jgi:hypothetical protein